MSSTKLAKKHGCSHETVIIGILKRNNIPIRSKIEASQLRYGRLLDESQIIQDYQSGLSTLKVSKKHGCSGVTVLNILKRNNIPSRSKKEGSQLRFGHVDESQIIQDYQSGMSTLKVAKKHGCTDYTVLRILKRNNIPSRALKEAQFLRYGHVEALDESQIIQDYQSGMSSTKLAKKHGCSDKTVRKIIKRSNIPIRSMKEAQYLRYGRLEALDESQIIQDYQSGMSSTKLAKKHGCTDYTVLNILKRNNIPSRALKEVQYLRYGRLLDESQIIRDYQSGMSSYRVAKKHGCSYATVIRILKRSNIPIRALKKTT